LPQAHVEAEEFLKVTLATEEHTFRVLAFKTNSRVPVTKQSWTALGIVWPMTNELKPELTAFDSKE
jgi:hypothetical protein